MKPSKSRYFWAFLDIRFYLAMVPRLRQFVRNLMEDYETTLHARTDEANSELTSSDTKARLRLRKDIFVSNYDHLHLGPDVEIDSEARMVFPPDIAGDSSTRIALGKKAYVGRRVGLGVLRGNCISVGDYSSINDNCMILGDVCIERYCTFSLNVFISSGNHYSTLFPTWLIKDQDAWVQNNPDYSKKHSKPVHIEEDCWLGWGVFVKQGIYIGRGAVIGAYTVVTRDVPPYSVQIGAPNREIARRFDFQPPQELQALNENHWPYFYAGFLMRQDDIAASREQGVLFAGPTVRLVLRGGEFDVFRISGQLKNQIEELKLRVMCNRLLLGEIFIKDCCFSEELQVNPAVWERAPISGLPIVMQGYNEIELQVVAGTGSGTELSTLDQESYYGISSISAHSTKGAQ